MSIFALKMKVAPLCPTLFDPMDYIVPGILQARILEWVAFPFSKAFKRHILTKKNAKTKMNLRKAAIVSEGDARRIAQLLPY